MEHPFKDFQYVLPILLGLGMIVFILVMVVKILWFLLTGQIL